MKYLVDFELLSEVMQNLDILHDSKILPTVQDMNKIADSPAWSSEAQRLTIAKYKGMLREINTIPETIDSFADFIDTVLGNYGSGTDMIQNSFEDMMEKAEKDGVIDELSKYSSR